MNDWDRQKTASEIVREFTSSTFPESLPEFREDTGDARRRQIPARTECVCGGAIVAVTWLPHDIIDAVRRHQIEPIHLTYDILVGNPLASWQLRAGPRGVYDAG